MKLTKEIVRKMMRSIHLTHQHELTCGECFNEVDRFAEMELTGMNAVEAMPLVQEHLERCGYCREEYEALLTALRAIVE
jgi:predicted anti-sigma-YlaC factor YlaD